MGREIEPTLYRSLSEGDAAYRSCFCVGGVSVAVAGRCLDDVALVPSLLPFRVETSESESDIDIRVEWVGGLSSPASCRLFDSGTTWQLYQSEVGFQFDINAPALGERPYKKLLVDPRFRHATLQLSQESFARSSCVVQPLEYPLDELLIMHRLTQEKAIELHGCGIVGANGIGNLFVGHSGAGKSTTTRLWTACEDVEVLSDDRIIVRRDQPGRHLETPLEAAGGASKHGVPRLRENCASRTSHSARDDKRRGIRMYGTPWHGEARYASPNSAPLERIFVLEHGRGNLLTPLTPSQAVAELFARSFVPFHRHEYVDSALVFLQELVEAVPVYRFAFEPDQRAVDTILNLR